MCCLVNSSNREKHEFQMSQLTKTCKLNFDKTLQTISNSQLNAFNKAHIVCLHQYVYYTYDYANI